jgi:methanethiol S-methyltransferase
VNLQQTFPAAADLILLAASWIGYFLIHSWLASLGMKRWLERHRPDWLAAYRLVYNLLATLLLLPPLVLMWQFRTAPLWHWEGGMALLAYLLMLLACAGFIWSLRWYDSREFLGLRQWQRQQQDIRDQEQLHISPLHRYVRHPWYSLGLVLVWTQDMDPARLLSAVLITLYLIVGSWLEERKLIVYHGARYRDYRKRVPGLIPLPGRVLSNSEAEELSHSVE